MGGDIIKEREEKMGSGGDKEGKKTHDLRRDGEEGGGSDT